MESEGGRIQKIKSPKGWVRNSGSQMPLDVKGKRMMAASDYLI